LPKSRPQFIKKKATFEPHFNAALAWNQKGLAGTLDPGTKAKQSEKSYFLFTFFVCTGMG
jgi:hypothetical protein